MSNEELTGRELDIAIVERVMDWLPPDNPATKAMRSRLRLTHPSYNDHYLTPEGELRKPPYYSVDAAATMEVVEKMRENGWSFACTLYEGKLPYASFCKLTAASSRNAEAESLPEAIRRAALATLSDRED